MSITAIILGLASLAAAGVGGKVVSMDNANIRNTESLDDAIAQLRASNGSNWLNTLTDRELEGILNNYRSKRVTIDNMFGLYGDHIYNYDVENALQDLAKLAEASSLSQPEAPDYQAIYNAALKEVEDENNAIAAVYDEDLKRQKALYEQQLTDSNNAYNQNVEQILSNDYQNNARLLGTVRSEMQRSQRNALESGASAGIRIAGNINTMLSMQNQQAQQSLATSNNLAQMLLTQQQANAGIRRDYGDYLSQDTSRRAALKSGKSSKVADIANTNFGVQNEIYNQKMNNYENSYSSTVGATNPFANSYQAYMYNNKQNKSTQ